MPGTITLLDPYGVSRDVPAESADAALAQGWKAPTHTDIIGAATEAANTADYGGVGGAIGAVGAAGLRGATLGLSDVAARALGGEDAASTLSGLRSQHPYLSTGAELAGALAPALLSGGASLPASLATRAGASVSEGLGAGLLARAAGGATEGAIFGAGAGVSELALDRDPLTWERAASTLGSNVLFGGAIGGATGLVMSAAERGLTAAKGAIDSRLAGTVEDRAIAATNPDLLTMKDPELTLAHAAEVERIAAEQKPIREAAVRDLDAWRNQNRDTYWLRAGTDTSQGASRDVFEAGKAFTTADMKMIRMLDNRAALAENPAKAQYWLEQQRQALDEIVPWAEHQKIAWQADVDAAPEKIRAQILAGEVKGEVPGKTAEWREGGKAPDYETIKAHQAKAGKELEQSIAAREVGARGYFEPAGSRTTPTQAEAVRKTMPEWQHEPIRLGVAANGDTLVSGADRMRLAAAIEADAPIQVRWSVADRAPMDAIPVKSNLPVTRVPSGLDRAVERVLKERQGLQWGEGGAIKDGLKASTIVKHADELQALVQRHADLQAKFNELVKPVTSERLAAIESAREALKIPRERSVGERLLSHLPGGGLLNELSGMGGKAVGGLRAGANKIARRTGEAVSAFAGAIAPQLEKATPIATKFLSQVSYGARTARKAPDDAPTTLPQLFKARTDEIKQQTAYDASGIPRVRPAARQAIADRLRPIRVSDPIAADRLETLAVRRLEYLSSLIPRRPDYGMVLGGPDKWQPSDMEMRTWARSAAAVEDPTSVEYRIAHGSVTPEDAAAYWAVYPERGRHLQQSYMIAMASKTRPLPYTRQLALGIFLGKPLTPAMHPRVLGVLQAQFPDEPGSAGGTQAPKAEPQFGSMRKSLDAPTPAQVRSQGARR
jgi:hypothetical protein